MANVGEARSRAVRPEGFTLDRVGGEAPSYLCPSAGAPANLIITAQVTPDG